MCQPAVGGDVKSWLRVFLLVALPLRLLVPPAFVAQLVHGVAAAAARRGVWGGVGGWGAGGGAGAVPGVSPPVPGGTLTRAAASAALGAGAFFFAVLFFLAVLLVAAIDDLLIIPLISRF